MLHYCAAVATSPDPADPAAGAARGRAGAQPRARHRRAAGPLLGPLLPHRAAHRAARRPAASGARRRGHRARAHVEDHARALRRARPTSGRRRWPGLEGRSPCQLAGDGDRACSKQKQAGLSVYTEYTEKVIPPMGMCSSYAALPNKTRTHDTHTHTPLTLVPLLVGIDGGLLDSVLDA